MPIASLSPVLAVYFSALAFAAGACLGSFVCCACSRKKEGESALKGRSSCPCCGRRLKANELIPIFSYIALKGRCRGCGAKIDILCPISEAVLAAAYLAALLAFGISASALEAALFYTLLLAESLCDIYTGEVPDFLHLLGAAVFLVFAPFDGGASERLISGLLGALLCGGGIFLFSLAADKALGCETLGGADVKLFAVLGLYFGPAKSLLAVILSCAAGLILAAVKRLGRREAFAFIPCISAAAFAVSLFGDVIIERYLGLFAL